MNELDLLDWKRHIFELYAEVRVAAVKLARRFVEPNFFDLSHNHRRCRRIFRTKRGDSRGARFGIGATASASPTAASPACGACRRRKRSHRAGAAFSRCASRAFALIGGIAATAAARLIFRRTRHLGQKLARLRIVFAHRIQPVHGIPNVDESFAVHRHAVPLRRIERADHIAFLVDVNHRRRPRAAIRARYFPAQFHIPQIVRPIEHPNVVVLIDREPRNAAHLPFIRQRLRPVSIKLVLRRSQRLRAHSSTQRQ